jgi:DNA-binding XRE family transcriptional regulator
MRKEPLEHINRRLTAAERRRHERIQAAVVADFPPKKGVHPNPSPPGIPARIRQARQTKGLTWYALAKAAGIPNQATIRDIEQGKDVKLSNLQAVAAALGLKLELIEQVA